jgi:hypothetical protein
MEHANCPPAAPAEQPGPDEFVIWQIVLAAMSSNNAQANNSPSFSCHPYQFAGFRCGEGK